MKKGRESLHDLERGLRCANGPVTHSTSGMNGRGRHFTNSCWGDRLVWPSSQSPKCHGVREQGGSSATAAPAPSRNGPTYIIVTYEQRRKMERMQRKH